MNVTNYSYGVQAARSGEHAYTVSIGRDGLPTGCTCPADEYQPGPCKHAVACAADREVLDEAMHGGSEPATDTDANQPVASDGGASEPNMTCENPDCGRRYNYVDEGPACPEYDAWGEQDPEPEGLEL